MVACAGVSIIFCYNPRAMSIISPRNPSLIRRIDFALVATLILCLFTTWPLLQRPGLPNGTDTLYHTYRVAEMDRAWAHGVLLPQWAETFYYGYGSPVFHYYASMTYYLTSVLMLLFSLNAADSLRALTVLSMLLAGGGMYLFVRDQAGKLPGIIAALVYVYSPYIVFTEPYARGAYPELLALAWFPLVMWRYGWLIDRGGGKAFALAALSSGLLIITHNLMALVLTGLLLTWVVWQGLTRVTSMQRLALAVGAVVVGVGLAGYFWIPVILEQDAVRLGNLTAVAQLDYRNFFVPLRDLLAFSPRPDAGAINGLLHQLNLGVAGWLLALAGMGGVLLLWAWRELQTRGLNPLPQQLARLIHNSLFFILAAAAMIFLMLPLADFLWDAAAPLAFLQFPWRLLGPVAFALAVLAGYNALWIERLPGRIGAVIVALVIALPILLALPTLYVDEWEFPTIDTTVAAYHAAELSGLQRATTFSDEYLPSTIGTEPSPNADLLADYADGYPVDRANRAVLPDAVDLTLIDNGPQHSLWQVASDEAFTLEALTYYFPSWQAEIDDVPVEVRPSEPHGMITFDVAAGSHTIRLFMGQTPDRWLGIVVTGVSFVVVVIAIFIFGKSTPESAVSALPAFQRRGAIAGGVLALALMLVFMREGWAWVNSPPGMAIPAQDQTVYNLGDQIQLLGYDLNSRIFRPGDRLELTLYWYGREPVDYGYATFVHVANGGPPAAQADKQNPAGRPTLKWTVDGYIRDPYIIDLPESLSPGEYQLSVGMYTCDTRPSGECGNGDRLTITSEDGQSLGDALPLGVITVN